MPLSFLAIWQVFLSRFFAEYISVSDPGPKAMHYFTFIKGIEEIKKKIISKLSLQNKFDLKDGFPFEREKRERKVNKTGSAIKRNGGSWNGPDLTGKKS